MEATAANGHRNHTCFVHTGTGLCEALIIFRCGFSSSAGYSSEGQVKLEVLYRVKSSTVVLHRDWITYSKTAPHTLPQQSGMGASLSASGEGTSPQDSPQADQAPRRGDALVAELLKECVRSEWVGSPSSAMVEALCASLCPLSHDDLAKVDYEVAASLERSGLLMRADMGSRQEESPPTGGQGLNGSPNCATLGGVGGGWVRWRSLLLFCVHLCRDHAVACSG